LTASLGKVSLPLTSKENSGKSDRPEAEKQLKLNLPLQREVNTSANNWRSKKDTDGDKKAVGFLWNADPRLPQLEQIQQSDDNWFNQTEAQFVERSIIQKRRNIRRTWIGVSVAFLTLIGIFIQLQQTELREKASRVRNLNQPLDKLILAIQATAQSQSILKPFLTSAFGEVQARLAEAIEVSRESNSIKIEQNVNAVAISDNGQYIAIATSNSNPDQSDGRLSLRNFRGDEINNFKVIDGVYSIIFSPDNKTILINPKNGGQSQLLDFKGKSILLDFKGKLIQDFPVSDNPATSSPHNPATFSPQGNMIVTNLKKRVQLWDLKGNLIVDFPVSKEDVTFNSIAVSPQSNMIVVSLDEIVKPSDLNFIQKVQLWDLRGNLIRNFPVPKGKNRVYSVAFSHDGQRVVGVIGEPDKPSSTVHLHLWDIKGNQLKDFSNSLEDEANSTKALSVNGFTNKDVISGLKSAATMDMRYYSVTFTTDGQKIISTGKDTNKNNGDLGLRLGLWNIKGDSLHSLQQLLFKEAKFLSFSRDGKYAITFNEVSGNSYDVKLWDLQGNAIAAFSGSQTPVNAVAISPDGKTIASGSEDGSVRLWDSKGNFISQMNPPDSKEGLSADTSAISISSNGQTLVSGTNYSPDPNSPYKYQPSGTVHLWNLQGTLTGTFKAYNGVINAIAISADGNTIVTSGGSNEMRDYKIRLWDRLGNLITENFQSLDETGEKRFDGSKVAISLDGQTIVGTEYGSTYGSTFQLWDRQGKTISKPLKGHKGCIFDIAISSDGKTIVSASNDGTVRLWDRQGNPIGQPFQNPNPRSVAISNDGEYIVTGGGDNRVRLWDRQGNLIGQPMTGHPFLVSTVAISPDKSYIVSSDDNYLGTLRLWRAGTWQTWLQIGCNRLRYHPVLKTPETEVAKGAKETCEKYVWNLTQQPGQNGEN
jgi:WD40 repeat protein